MSDEALEAQRTAEKIEAWYAAETIILRAKQLLLSSGLMLKNAGYPEHLEIFSALRNTIIALEVILEHLRKGSKFEEPPRPRVE